MSKSIAVYAVLPPDAEWHEKFAEYSEYADDDKDIPFELSRFFCHSIPAENEMLWLIHAIWEYDDNLCEETVDIKASDIPPGTVKIRIKRF